jgi:hypothetical protein
VLVAFRRESKKTVTYLIAIGLCGSRRNQLQ